jgi:hypothetical protein
MFIKRTCVVLAMAFIVGPAAVASAVMAISTAAPAGIVVLAGGTQQVSPDDTHWG